MLYVDMKLDMKPILMSVNVKKEVICQRNWYCYEHASDNPANVKERLRSYHNGYVKKKIIIGIIKRL